MIEIAKKIVNNLQNVDIFGRLGGDKFMAILPETNLDGAIEVPERVCSSIEEIEIKSETEMINISISIGVRSYSKGMKNLAAMIATVDKALYKAKKESRNKICT